MDFAQQPERDQPQAEAENPEQRKVWSEQWEAVLEQRERAANERETIADRREQAANAREAEADRREQTVSEREYCVLDLEERSDHRARALGLPTVPLRERALEAITRSRNLVASSMVSLERSKEALHRVTAADHRRGEETERRIAGADRARKKANSDTVQSSLDQSTE